MRKEEPHSRRSNAYSVGKTILEVGNRVVGSKFSQHASRVRRIAEALSCDDDEPRARMTLNQALEELGRGNALLLLQQQPPPPSCAPSGATVASLAGGGAAHPAAVVSRPR